MKSVVCNVCGSAATRQLYSSTMNELQVPDSKSAYRCTSNSYGCHYAIVQCQMCGLIYASPRRDEVEILEEYSGVEDTLYLEERPGRVLTFRQHVKSLHNLTGPPSGRRLLDVGAYVGVFVEVAAAAGWQAVGLEPSAWAVAQAQQQGVPVQQGTLADVDWPAETFDVITMWDVIEHFADPAAEVRRAQHLLKPGGWLVIHTMDVQSPLSRLMGRRWPWYMEMHLYYFSRKTLRRLLTGCGFEWVTSGAQGRYIRLSYLVTRLQPFSQHLARLTQWLVERFGWGARAIPINLGDLVTVYARRGLDGCAAGK